ncbi:MAG: YifB family Mg chelatase-like AAA ATPase [Actinobacteria bacterium]|nr:YifB family Mg chelatase-like AAA ATPase [Actinomycetota bacterium]
MPSGSEPVVGVARSVALVGLRAVDVTVEVSISAGLPCFSLIGTTGTAGRQAGERVRAALHATGIRLPSRKILASLAPADVPTSGARFDLALAAALLVRLGAVASSALTDAAFLGELALDGTVRAVSGVLPAAAHLAAAGVDRLFVADDNVREASLASGIGVIAVGDLSELLAILDGAAHPRALPARPPPAAADVADLADVRGQAEARRALEIAAAGGHHLLLLGPPGCGKSMLAARLVGVLPSLTEQAALELTAIRSVAGLLAGTAPITLDRTPPLRAPHHATTAAALLGGGGGVARPGEISLATHGVLFMDELFEWPRRLLDALREPLEQGTVRIARAQATVCYPAAFQLVCAANPCPCGGAGTCDCTDAEVWTYRRRLSGPLADRIDLAPRLSALEAGHLVDATPGEPSHTVAARVRTAREVARERWGVVNRLASAEPVRATARPAALRTLGRAVESGALSGRGFDRALRVARTCADLAGDDQVDREHVLEALAHRAALRAARVAR